MQLELELAYYDAALQHINHSTMQISLKKILNFFVL